MRLGVMGTSRKTTVGPGGWSVGAAPWVAAMLGQSRTLARTFEYEYAPDGRMKAPSVCPPLPPEWAFEGLLATADQLLSPTEIDVTGLHGEKCKMLIIIPGTVRGKAASACKQAANTLKGPLHHIATDKNLVSTVAGGPFTPKFEALFEKAGMTLQDAMNKIRILGHYGPHPAYNQAVFDRLSKAVEGLAGDSYRQALQKELTMISRESGTPGSALNRLLTGE